MNTIRNPAMSDLMSQSPSRASNPSEWMHGRSSSDNEQQQDLSADKQSLYGERIAILASDGFEKSELIKSREILEEAGAHVDVISPGAGHITSWESDNWSLQVDVDATLDIPMVERYAGLVLPGGLISVDSLRNNPLAVQFVEACFECRKPVAAIAHAPWLLLKANVLKGRMLTSCPSLQTDICNAGGKWIDQAVVEDGLLTTGRTHSDLHLFLQAMVTGFSKWHEDRVKIGPLDI